MISVLWIFAQKQKPSGDQIVSVGSFLFSQCTEVFTIQSGRPPVMQWFYKIKFLMQKRFIFLFLHAMWEFFSQSIWTDFRTICVNCWRIEKLCSLTNCISPHLARPHMLHTYFIMEVWWMWVPHPSVYSWVCVVSSEALLFIFISRTGSSSLACDIPLQCTYKTTVFSEHNE